MGEEMLCPLVSVVMPAYNAESFIEEAILSVLSQSITALELLVIDDGSSDGTVSLVESFCQKDSRVRLILNETNMGAAGSRNRGLDLCTGKYVALLDSDDYWKPGFLEKSIAKAEQTNAELVYCSYELVDEQGRKVCNDFIVPEQTDLEHSLIRNVISCSTVLIARRAVDTYRFPLGLYHEDIALWFRMLKEGCAARGIPEVLAAYRQRSGSKTSSKLKSAVRRWPIYRSYLGLSVPKSLWLMVQYGIYGLIKYKRK